MRSNSHSKTSAKLKRPSTEDLCYTIADFNREFPSDDGCLEYIKEQRRPNGLTRCEKCNTERKHHRVTGRTADACDHCGNHIYPLAGTVFRKSTTSQGLVLRDVPDGLHGGSHFREADSARGTSYLQDGVADVTRNSGYYLPMSKRNRRTR